jgi:hypothetical protein
MPRCQLSLAGYVYLAVRVITIAVLALLAAPTASAARGSSQFPAGNSAASQYLEIVPTANGGQPANRIGAGGGGSGGAVAPKTASALAQHGQAGLQATAVARATAPSGIRGIPAGSKTGARRKGAAAGKTTAIPSASGPSPASEVGGVLTGSGTGGLGPVLPGILAATAIVAFIALLIRRRRRAK